jgi:hypothetical protein
MPDGIRPTAAIDLPLKILVREDAELTSKLAVIAVLAAAGAE